MSLLTDLDGFYTEHRCCGDLDAGVDGDIVWMGATAGPAWRVAWTRTPMPAQIDVRARGHGFSCRAVHLT